MKKEYEKPYINTAEIKEIENITALSSVTVQNGNLFGVISYGNLKSY